MDTTEPWYAVKSIFFHEKGNKYEERIVLFRAENFDDATKQAEIEAKKYASTISGIRFIEWVDVFHLFDEKLAEGLEVYSKLTISDLAADEYIDKMYYSDKDRVD
jgi:hypothetical protein